MNREDTLKKAEKLLRDGKLGPAIEEYVRLVDEYPQDWSAVNALGDLYIKANKPGLAIAQFTRMADHLFGEGFLPKAQAVYKKALKLDGGHKHTLRRLAEIATKQGHMADARQYQRQLGEVPLPEATAPRAKGPAAATEPPAAPSPAPSEAATTPAGEATVPEGPAPESPEPEPSPFEPAAALEPLPAEPLPVEQVESIPPSAPAVAAIDVPAGVAPSLHAGSSQVSGLDEHVAPFARVPAVEPVLPAIEPPMARSEGMESTTGVLEIDLSDALNEFEMADPSPAEEPATPVPDKPKSLAAVFADMRSAATFGQQETTASAHFQLATRHVEASRWDEAIAAFEAAARAPAFRFEAASELGRLLLSRGMIQEGIDWLERAIEAPAPDADAHLALMYELAEALEQIEEWARALAVLLELDAEAPRYRDVDARVAKLKRLVAGN